MKEHKLTPKNVSEILKHERNQELCLSRINRYFGPFETRKFSNSTYEKLHKPEELRPQGSTGSFFEKYSKKSDPESFDGNDVSAAICLSIEGKGFWVASLLNESIDLSCFSNLPYETCISDVSTNFFDEEGIGQVLKQLLGINGIGLVVASKLLASKRPYLFPIFDSDVSKFFEFRNNTNEAIPTYLEWCKSWKKVVSDPEVKKELGNIRDKISIQPNDQISSLRILDVTFWLDGKTTGERKLGL
ncbi:MAG: DUF6308 family protein [Bacteroidetes bacterium]|nr:DUF6308 family protein [Bacteroidota bacterium]